MDSLLDTLIAAMGDWLVILPVIVPLLAAGIGVAAWERTGFQAAIACLGAVLMVIITGLLFAAVWQNGPVTMTMGNWLPPFGITFIADMLSAGLAFTGAVIGLVTVLFAFSNIGPDEGKRGFYPLLMALMTGVSGAFLTGDIFNLYVWFEVILIASFGLLVIGRTREQLDGAVKYAVLNLIATTLFLVGTGLFYGVAGTLNMADLHLTLAERGMDGTLIIIALMYLMAFGMKSAVFPLFFWLPAAYHTAHPVVGAVFAALLTKVGVYVLLRVFTLIFPITGGDLSGLFEPLVLGIAIATMMIGAVGALAQSDFRRIVAFLVVSGIGYMLLGLSLGGEALTGSILYVIHSMVVTAALFMAAGLARSMAGDSWLHGRGIYRHAPVFAGFMLAVAISMAGSPPFGGLWPKVILVKAGLEMGATLSVVAVLLSGFLTLVALGRAFALAVWADPQDDDQDRVPDYTFARSGLTALRAGQIVPLGLLVAVTALMGLWPAPFITFASEAAQALSDYGPYLEAVRADGLGETPEVAKGGSGK